MGWPKSSFEFYVKIRHIFHFHQELYWTICSLFCSTTFCLFLGNFIIPFSQKSFIFLKKVLFQVIFAIFQGNGVFSTNRIFKDWNNRNFKDVTSGEYSSLLYGLSYQYMAIGKNMSLTIQTFISKVMSLFINMLSRFVIVFLPRREHLLISWLQLLSAVILEPKKIKSITVSIVSPSICHEVMEQDVMTIVFSMLSFKPTFPPMWMPHPVLAL